MRKTLELLLITLVALAAIGCGAASAGNSEPQGIQVIEDLGRTGNASWSVVVDPDTNVEYIVSTVEMYTPGASYDIVSAITPRLNVNGVPVTTH